jgi:hypothetical protein
MITKTCHECGVKQKCCGGCISCDIGIQLFPDTWVCSVGCHEAYSGQDNGPDSVQDEDSTNE